MQCSVSISLSSNILDEVEKLCRNFLWGQKDGERKLAWVSWEKLHLPKRNGHLGIRDMRAFNKALFAKQA